MYAMELNGSHVGRQVRIKWTYKTPTGRVKNGLKEGKIVIVHHHPGGDVSINKPTYNSRYSSSATKWKRVPPNAEVEFI